MELAMDYKLCPTRKAVQMTCHEAKNDYPMGHSCNLLLVLFDAQSRPLERSLEMRRKNARGLRSLQGNVPIKGMEWLSLNALFVFGMAEVFALIWRVLDIVSNSQRVNEMLMVTSTMISVFVMAQALRVS
jgi:hypothetical protein